MGFPESDPHFGWTAEENDKCLSAMARVVSKRAGKGELAAAMRMIFQEVKEIEEVNEVKENGRPFP